MKWIADSKLGLKKTFLFIHVILVRDFLFVFNCPKEKLLYNT